MLSFLPAFLRGCICSLIVALNIFIAPVAIIILAGLRLILPFKPWRNFWNGILHAMPSLWVDGNNFALALTHKLEWDVQGVEKLDKKHWYFLICNHQSWADIFVLYRIFNRKVPSIKFFMKQELIWIPIIGIACKLLHFPFLYRYSKDYLKKHPEMKGKDIEITRKACEKFKYIPITMTIFPEGTRFTEAKKQSQNSPYQHLLKAKPTGFVFALSVMGEYTHEILNVTIAYPGATRFGAWDFFCGRMRKVVVRVERIPVTQDMLGDYVKDKVYRVRLHSWMNELWRRKDEQMSVLLAAQAQEAEQ